MRFGRAARGERLGKEVEDDRPFMELLGEVELEGLAADGAVVVKSGALAPRGSAA